MHWPATLAIIIFLAGSALSGLSQSMAELIAFRAIQGLGAGGLMVGAMATLGDIVAPRERGQRSRQPAARTRALTGRSRQERRTGDGAGTTTRSAS
jgi:MFS family permease